MDLLTPTWTLLAPIMFVLFRTDCFNVHAFVVVVAAVKAAAHTRSAMPVLSQLTEVTIICYGHHFEQAA